MLAITVFQLGGLLRFVSKLVRASVVVAKRGCTFITKTETRGTRIRRISKFSVSRVTPPSIAEKLAGSVSRTQIEPEGAAGLQYTPHLLEDSDQLVDVSPNGLL
jgi:hypothetical protein